MKDNVWTDTVSFIIIASPVCYASDERIRIVNTLFNVKLQALGKELAALLKRSLPYTRFLKISKVTVLPSSSEAGFERLRSKTSLSKTRKASKDQKKNFAYAVQNG